MPDFTIPERVLEAGRKAGDEAEVFHLRASSTPVHFEADRIKSIDTNETAGAAVRLIKNGRVGFSSTTDLDNFSAVVDAAAETALFGPEARFRFPEQRRYPEVPVEDASAIDVPLERMVEIGQKVIDAVRGFSGEVRMEGGVSRSTSTVTLLNSRGGSFQYTKTGFRVGFSGTVIHGEDMLFVSDSESSCRPITDGSGIVSSIVRQLEWARESAVIEAGPMSVIFLPTAVPSTLLTPLLAGLNGKAVLQGTSPLAGRLGDRIVDERFNVTDDATLPFVPSSRPSDDEGVPSRRLALVDHGVAGAFLYDLQTAGLAGAESTGSGERGLGSLPSPSAGVLLVGEGEATLEELMAEIGTGLIVERLLGAGQSNILGGDFNANVLLGYKVEGGRVAGRVKNVMISGNAYRALNELIGIGSDGRWLGGGLFTPAVACAGVSVTAKA